MSELLGQPSGLEAGQKLRALEEVLSSTTLSRSEQLRKFLRYVGEMEASGRASGITEYSIGVDGLGRPPSFVPAEDGIVRNRAHALRQKLLEYYTRENPRAEVVIDLPRGSYVPRFQAASAPEPVEFPPLPPLPVEPARVSEGPSGSRFNAKWFALGFLVASLVAAGAGAVLWVGSNSGALDAVVREAWGPLAAPDADATVVISYPYHLALREYHRGARPDNSAIDSLAPPEIEAEYRNRNPGVGGELHMQFTAATRLGEVLGLVSTLRTMGAGAASYQVVHDRAVTLTSMRDRNAILFGDPNMSPLLAKYLEKGFYAITYSDTARDFVITHRKAGAAPSYRSSPRNPSELREFPGLLTVFASDGSNGRKRTVIFSGANSSGAQAAAEFFSSPPSLRNLRERFAREGIQGFPQAYQVVLKGVAEGQSLLSFSYQEHRVLAR